jgi:hypothetical protein
MGDGAMGVLTTGMMQSWLPLILVVLSQLFTLLFIHVIDRVIQALAGQIRSGPAAVEGSGSPGGVKMRTDLPSIPLRPYSVGSGPEPLGTVDPILTPAPIEI